MQGTVKRGRGQGKQTKRWEDNIREWAGLEFAKSQRAVENKEKRRKMVAKSSVVSERPLRLRDRRDERERDVMSLVLRSKSNNKESKFSDDSHSSAKLEKMS